MGIEPTAPTLGKLCSTPELIPRGGGGEADKCKGNEL